MIYAYNKIKKFASCYLDCINVNVAKHASPLESWIRKSIIIFQQWLLIISQIFLCNNGKAHLSMQSQTRIIGKITFSLHFFNLKVYKRVQLRTKWQFCTRHIKFSKPENLAVNRIRVQNLQVSGGLNDYLCINRYILSHKKNRNKQTWIFLDGWEFRNGGVSVTFSRCLNIELDYRRRERERGFGFFLYWRRDI